MVRRARTGVGVIAFALFLGGPWLSGCLLESHVPTDPLPLELFCDAFFDALCEPMDTCGCAPAAVTECRAEQRALCAAVPSPAIQAAIDADRLRYDAVAAAALVERLRARGDGCEGFVESLDWRVHDLYSLGGVFEGRVSPGAPCEPLGVELISECAFGSCAPGDGGATCRGAVGLGDRCDADHQCVDLDALLTLERGIDRLTLRCVDGACAAWVEAGGACAADGDCRSGRCVDDRCEVLDDGASCTLFRQCASGWCRGRDGTCQSGGNEDGAPCDDDRACASYVCVANTCAPPVCGTF